MPKPAIDSQLLFPSRIWVKTSETPMCNNPNCCSVTSWVDRCKDAGTNNADDSHNTRECTNEQHNVHCCNAPGNKVCSPADWVFLYSRVEPTEEDKLRRAWMNRWMRGLCTLHEAVSGFEDEMGSCVEREWGAAA